MRKRIVAFVFAAALLVAMAVPLFGGVTPASAKVHAISQASCGEPEAGGNAGANKSGANSPGGPIPVTSGGALLPGEGGNLDGVLGLDCDAPGDVRQN